MRRRSVLLVPFALAIAMAAAGCGEDSRGTDDAPSTSAAAAPSSAAATGSAAGASDLNGVKTYLTDHTGALALTHIVPPLPLKGLEEPFLGDARERFEGPLWLARDGDLYSLPAGGSGVERANMLT